MFSSLEVQGLRTDIDGACGASIPTAPTGGRCSAPSAPAAARTDAFHFQTQLSDGRIVAEEYYNQNNSGFGAYYVFPLPPAGFDRRLCAWAPPIRTTRAIRCCGSAASTTDGRRPRGSHSARRASSRSRRFTNGRKGRPTTRCCNDKNSPRVGKFTHPSARRTTTCSPSGRPARPTTSTRYDPQLDGGIYLIKGGKPIDEPGQMC